MEWATKCKDHSFIANLVDSLPSAVLDEQVRLHQASTCGPVVPHAPQAFVVYPHKLKSREEAAKGFDMELLNAGWAPGTRLPRASATKAAGKLVWSKTKTLSRLSDQANALRRWHSEFRQMCVDEPSRSGGRSIHVRRGAARPAVEHGRRQRRLGMQGAQSVRCPWVREALYQWFVSIRYSSDWKECEGKAKRSGQ